MSTITASLLEYVLLGLLSQAPVSGYDLRKILTRTPLRHFSDSPGAIYPALRRLIHKKWTAVGAPQGARRRQEYRIGAAGRSSFIAWVRRPVTHDDAIYRTQEVILRFAFMGSILPPEITQRFIDGYQREMEEYVVVLQQYYKENGAAMPMTGRLAFEQGIAQYQANALWAQRASKTLKMQKG